VTAEYEESCALELPVQQREPNAQFMQNLPYEVLVMIAHIIEHGNDLLNWLKDLEPVIITASSNAYYTLRTYNKNSKLTLRFENREESEDEHEESEDEYDYSETEA
jgi:hypothetical protein